MTTQNLKFIDGDFIDSQSFELILENDGSFTEELQSIVFDFDGKEIAVNYTLFVEGHINNVKEDYEYQGGSYPILDSIDITINQIFIDEVETNVDAIIFILLENEIRKYVK